MGPNEAKYDLNDRVMREEYRWILHAEEDERFVKGWFCFQSVEPTRSNPKVTVNEITEI